MPVMPALVACFYLRGVSPKPEVPFISADHDELLTILLPAWSKHVTGTAGDGIFWAVRNSGEDEKSCLSFLWRNIES